MSVILDISMLIIRSESVFSDHKYRINKIGEQNNERRKK